MRHLKSNKGFTLVEILMVLLLIGILATLAITQFTNFSTEARNSTLKASLKVLRNGIATQNGQMRLRCNVATNAWPPLANITANDITSGGSPCTTTQVANAGDRLFVSGAIPPNPWGLTQSNTVAACVGAGCVLATRLTNACDGTVRVVSDDGWCYNVLSGEIWANTSRNDGLEAGTGVEAGY